MESPERKPALRVEEALAAALAEMESPVYDRNNPAFPKHRYATLGQFLETARPILAKHGLAMHNDTEALGDGNLLCVTVIRSIGGDSLRIAPVPVRVNMLKPQETGSGLTYARRYSASMALGIVADDSDDDGNLASGIGGDSRDERGMSRPRAAAPAPSPAPPRASAPAPSPAPDPKPAKEKDEIVFAEAAGMDEITMALADVKVVTGTAASTGREWRRWDLLGREMRPDGETMKIRVSTFDHKLGEKAFPLIGKTIDIVAKPGRGDSLDLVKIKGENDELPF